jgi:hypothetical protein
VELTGRLEAVHRYGRTWRADLRLAGGAAAPIHGASDAGIPSAAVVAGRNAIVAGIVRLPASGAADARPVVEPRSAADLRMSGASTVSGARLARGGQSPGSRGSGSSVRRAASAPDGRSGASGGGAGGGWGGAGPASSGSSSWVLGAGAPSDGVPIDVELGSLSEHLGQLVRVGGLIASLRSDGFDLDDGTASVRVRLTGRALASLDLVAANEPVNVIGRPLRDPDGSAALVADGADAIFRVGTLGEALPLVATAASTSAGSPTSGTPDPDLGGGSAAADGLTPNAPGSPGARGSLTLAVPATLAALGLTGLLVSLAGLGQRRRILRRRRVAERLRTYVAGSAPPDVA